MRIAGQQPESESPGDTRLPPIYLELAACVEQMEIDRSLRESNNQPDFPAGLAS